MNITEHEMRGLLTGKCIPGDMRVNEELPAYLVRKFAELKGAHDAHKQGVITWEKSMMAAIGEDGVGSVTKAIAKLKAQRDALAAEVSAIREQAEDVYAAGYNHGHLNTVDGIAYAPPVEDEFYHNALQVMLEVETPATDAYLNSVRAEAVEKLWRDSLNDVGQVLAEIGAYQDASEAAGIVHSEIQERVSDFAAQLRAGKDGE